MAERGRAPIERGVRRHEFNTLKDRVDKMEKAFADLADISETLSNIARYVRRTGPIVITAAVTAGFIDGRIGAFLKALFS